MKNLPSSGSLTDCVCVFSSHEDFSVYEAIYAGFDALSNLVIMCSHTDSDRSGYDCATYAMLDSHEAGRLAKRLNVGIHDLPMQIAESMSEWDEIVCPLPSHVKDCFKEITECLLDEGCRFTIERKPSANGYTTC